MFIFSCTFTCLIAGWRENVLFEMLRYFIMEDDCTIFLCSYWFDCLIVQVRFFLHSTAAKTEKSKIILLSKL